jgi:hypothetical protein
MGFNRGFFERFDQIISHYAKRETCGSPIVEFFLLDNTKFEVKNLSVIGNDWLEFTIYDKTGCSTDVVVPYEQIARIVLYRDPQKSEAIGFKV